MKKLLFIIIILIFFPYQTFAQTSDSSEKTLSGSGWAVGIIIGEPTGLSLKYNTFPVMGIAWSIENHFHFHADYWILNNTFLDVDNLYYYVGVGGKISLWHQDDKPKDSDDKEKDLGLGVRIPLGIQYFLIDEVEFFGEAVPGISLYPATDFDLDLAIGARYNF